MNRLYYILLISFLSNFWNCNDKKNELIYKNQISKLEQKNESLELDAKIKDSAIKVYTNIIFDVQTNLNEIHNKEKLLNEIKNSETKVINTNKIKQEFQNLFLLLADNNMKIKSLNNNIKTSKYQIASMDSIINQLDNTTKLKEEQILTGKSKLGNIENAFDELYIEYKILLKQIENDKISIENFEKKFNLAYYIIGSRKKLMESDIIEFKGGFAGYKSSIILKNDFDISNFIKIDIRDFNNITIDSEKIKLISNHNTSSYKIEKLKNKRNKLIIVNPEIFWNTSKYLVILENN